MGKRNHTDKAISNIMKWAERPEWSEMQHEVFDDHLDPVSERIGIGRGELGEDIVDLGYDGMVFGVIFEDFLSRRLPPDDKNIIDDYLQRRGWRESVQGRRYLQQLRDSVLSLYEVVDVTPGRHCDLRDLVRGGETIRVHERMGTESLVKWDRIAARVLGSGGRHHLAGGILPFTHEAAQKLCDVLDESREQFNVKLGHMAGNDSAAAIIDSVDTDDLFLRTSAPAFTAVWLMHTVEELSAPLPEVVNRHGESLMFVDTRFPVLADQAEEIARRLDAAPEWERDDPDADTWIWLPEPDPDNKTAESGFSIESFQDGEHLIFGTLELEQEALTLITNSMERAERGKAALEALLHGLVGPALSKLQTPDQMLAENETDSSGDTPEAQTDIDPEIAAEMIHDVLDKHYRQTLDETIPALDNQTPRQCAKSDQDRHKVVDWLKYLENSEQRRAARQGQEPYDSSWMWDELGLSQYRN